MGITIFYLFFSSKIFIILFNREITITGRIIIHAINNIFQPTRTINIHKVVESGHIIENSFLDKKHL